MAQLSVRLDGFTNAISQNKIHGTRTVLFALFYAILYTHKVPKEAGSRIICTRHWIIRNIAILLQCTILHPYTTTILQYILRHNTLLYIKKRKIQYYGKYHQANSKPIHHTKSCNAINLHELPCSYDRYYALYHFDKFQ